MNHPEFILKLVCQDTKGIVASVSGVLYQAGFNIIDSQQFSDVQSAGGTGLFFMRVHVAAPGLHISLDDLNELIMPVSQQFNMVVSWHDLAQRPQLLVMVSQHGHCLNDLLFRQRSGQLRADIAAVVSNHTDCADLAENFRIGFYHLPVGDGSAAHSKAAQEQSLMQLIQKNSIDLVVLARYMQILSPEMCDFLKGRAINIHHSFLPSFKGAKPYYQAHARGVKLIGATAHYVTPELDEGPIIEQDIARVDHSLAPEDFTAVGRDVECVVLARAVRWHVEHRVLMNGQKTVVFR